MSYKDVKEKCLFCDATIEGNQQFMLSGHNLPFKRGATPRWLKEKPEHKWVWNGLSDLIAGYQISYDFYLCPEHNDDEHYQQGFEWAQRQLDETKKQAQTIDLETAKAFDMLIRDIVRRKSVLFQHFSEHIDSCPDCQTELEEAKKSIPLAKLFVEIDSHKN